MTYISRIRRLYPKYMAAVGVQDNEHPPGMYDNPAEWTSHNEAPAGEGVEMLEPPGMHPVASAVGGQAPGPGGPDALDEDPMGNHIEDPDLVLASAATNMDALSRPEIGGTGYGEMSPDALDKPGIESQDDGQWGITKEGCLYSLWRRPRR